MAGPRASPLYREKAAELDALWRIWGWEGTVPVLDEDERQRILDLAVSGTTTGLTWSMQELFEQDDGIQTATRIVRLFTSPSIQLSGSRDPDAPVRLQLNDGSLGGKEQIARIEQVGPRARRRPRGPTFRLGQDLRVVERVTDEGDLFYAPGAVAYVEARRLWAEATRLQNAVLPDEEGVIIHSWATSSRWRLHPRWTGHLSLAGEGRLPYPDRSRIAVGWTSRTQPVWLVQPGLTRRFPRPDRERLPEWRVDVRLQWNLRWRVPSDVDRWPLDHELFAPGRPLPEVPDRQAMEPRDPLRPNLERAVEDPVY